MNIKRNATAPDPAPEPLAPGQSAYGQRDHQGVVAGQREVDDHDADQTRPRFRVAEELDRAHPRRCLKSAISSRPTMRTIRARANK
jgi:hypothetical protein